MIRCPYCDCKLKALDGRTFFTDEEIEEIRTSSFDVMETVDKILEKKKGEILNNGDL